MKNYETAKSELLKRRSNIKSFSKAFYKQFCRDLETAQKGIDEAIENNTDFSVTEYWKTTETHKTWFYKHNGGAYCELLTLV